MLMHWRTSPASSGSTRSHERATCVRLQQSYQCHRTLALQGPAQRAPGPRSGPWAGCQPASQWAASRPDTCLRSGDGPVVGCALPAHGVPPSRKCRPWHAEARRCRRQCPACSRARRPTSTHRSPAAAAHRIDRGWETGTLRSWSGRPRAATHPPEGGGPQPPTCAASGPGATRHTRGATCVHAYKRGVRITGTRTGSSRSAVRFCPCRSCRSRHAARQAASLLQQTCPAGGSAPGLRGDGRPHRTAPCR